MNLIIGLLVILILAQALGGYSSHVEERNVIAARSSSDDRDDYQRECESWRGWPKHYHPWYCEQIK